MPMTFARDPRIRMFGTDGIGIAIGPGAAPNKTGMLVSTEDVIIGNLAGRNAPAVQTYHTFVGALVGAAAITGAGGTGMGQKAGITATNIATSVFLGSKSAANLPSLNDDVFVGYGAAGFATATNLGRRTFVGLGAGDYDCGDYNIYVGWKSGKQGSVNDAANSWGNIGIGAQSLNSITGFGNICIGHAAGTLMTSATSNVVIGYRAGEAMTTGSNNTFLGYESGQGHTTTARCIFIGVCAGNTVPNGSQNIFVAGAGTSNGSDRVDHVFFGKGYAHAAPTGYTINGTGGLGANVPGADIKIAGGKGTGSAEGGNVVLQVAPAGGAGSSLNNLVDALKIAPDLKADFAGAIQFAPGSSVTPTNNGDVVIELTNNSTITLRAKGSDGTVRSATLTLS